MRELTIRIRFTKACLGNVRGSAGNNSTVKDGAVGLRNRKDIFLMPRDPNGQVTFLATWHKLNMKFAAQLLNIHQDEVDKIHWDIAVDGVVRERQLYKRYYRGNNGKGRFSLHEAFFVGQHVGINCVVPSTIDDDTFWRLLTVAGQYRGLSPWRPSEFGLYEVVSLRLRRQQQTDEEV